jgi:hypothetical protein
VGAPRASFAGARFFVVNKDRTPKERAHALYEAHSSTIDATNILKRFHPCQLHLIVRCSVASLTLGLGMGPPLMLAILQADEPLCIHATHKRRRLAGRNDDLAQ